MQPRIVQGSRKCETKSDEVHVFSFFIFAELDNAQPRRRNRVQLILFNIFSELARRLNPSGSAKTTLLATARLPNEQRTYGPNGPSMWNRQLYNKTFSSLGSRCSVSDGRSHGIHWR